MEKTVEFAVPAEWEEEKVDDVLEEGERRAAGARLG